MRASEEALSYSARQPSDNHRAAHGTAFMFLTSDTHFGHALMSRLRGFGYAAEAHDQALVDNWNRTIGA